MDGTTELQIAALERALATARTLRLEIERRAGREPDEVKQGALLDVVIPDALREEDRLEDAILRGRAGLEQGKRERAEAATAQMLAANQEMAAASREAARSSADAARWAKWAAIFTAVAAFAALAAVLIQLVQRKP